MTPEEKFCFTMGQLAAKNNPNSHPDQLLQQIWNNGLKTVDRGQSNFTDFFDTFQYIKQGLLQQTKYFN